MLFHRFGTLSHILASTDLNFYCTKKVSFINICSERNNHNKCIQAEDLSPNALLDKHAVDIVKQMQQLRGIDDPDYDNDSGSGPDRIDRRKTIHKLERAAQRKRQIGTLDVAFKRRFFKLNQNGQDPGTPILARRMTMKRETIKALENRRNTVLAEKRKSQMQTLGANADYGKVINGAAPVRNHRNSTTLSVHEVFDRGQVNSAFVTDEENHRNSLQLQARNNWNNDNNNSRM